MSVNTAHTSNGVLLHAGEFILLHCKNISMQFSGQSDMIFSGCKCGGIYLTSHRLIFNNKKRKDDMQSFSAPFTALSELQLEQPILGSNYIKGKVSAQPCGHFDGVVNFKLFFKAGGAIAFGKALKRAASVAYWYARNTLESSDPPPYTSPNAWYEAPPPAYQPPEVHSNWLPTDNNVFSSPTPNTVFISDSPPPYQGIGESSTFESVVPPEQYLTGPHLLAAGSNALRENVSMIQSMGQSQIGWSCRDVPPPYGATGCNTTQRNVEQNNGN